MIARINNALSEIADHARHRDGTELFRGRLKLPTIIGGIVERLIELARDDYRPSRIIIRPAILIAIRAEAQGDFAHYVTPDPDDNLGSRFLNLPLTPVSNAELADREWAILTRN